MTSGAARLLDLELRESASWTEPQREVIAAKPWKCDACSRPTVAGETLLVLPVVYRKGAARFRRRLGSCCYVPADLPPEARLCPWRRAAWDRRRARVERTGLRGRPRMAFSPAEVALVARLRGEGAGESRLARLFEDETGRRVSARRLAAVGRD